jgi:hypothetical protein
MFGYHKAKREKKKAKREREDLKRERAFLEGQKPELEQKQAEADKVKLAESTAQAKTDRQTARQEGKQYAEEVLSRDVQGLTPAQRNAMQFEANKQIQRQHQSANRKLLGDQSQHGIVGKGGVGYAQQRDLQKLANESQGQATRDIDKLNADLALKKLAAMFNIEQGEVAQTQLDKQMASDELKLSNEQKRQRYFEDQFNRLFSRV